MDEKPAMSFSTYKDFWDDKASTVIGALAAVDGSTEESVVRATGQYTAQQVHTALALKPGDRVLELGCGVGRIGLWLAPRIAHWHGVDISSNMIGVARERLQALPNVGFDVLDRSSLAMLPDASFDAAYSIAVFIHMDKEDLFLYLRELRRVLKPGGRLFFDTWNLAHPVGFRRFDFEVATYARYEPGTRKDVARNQFSTPQEIQIYLHQAGFDIVQLMSDSPWVQALAMAGADDLSLAADRQRSTEKLAEIAYPATWTEFFNDILDIFNANVHPRGLYERLQQSPPSREREVFIPWLLALWRQLAAQWGEAPAGP